MIEVSNRPNKPIPLFLLSFCSLPFTSAHSTHLFLLLFAVLFYFYDLYSAFVSLLLILSLLTLLATVLALP